MHPRAFRLSDGWLCLLPITCPCAIEVFSSRQIVRLDSVHLAPLLQLFTEKCRREFEGQYRVFFVLRMLRASKHKWIKYGITCNTKIFLLHKKMHYKHDKHECWYEVGKTVTVADSGGGVRTPPPNLGYFFFTSLNNIQNLKLATHTNCLQRCKIYNQTPRKSCFAYANCHNTQVINYLKKKDL